MWPFNRREKDQPNGFDKTVAEGAAVLDEVAPGWQRHVSASQLDMSKGTKCVAGQVFGHWLDAPSRVRFHPAFFQAGYNPARYDEYQEAWERYLNGKNRERVAA